MALIQHYATLKQAHVAVAAASVALFAARGIAVLARARWPMLATMRDASVAIDTLLAATGGALWWTLSLNPLRERWPLAKLLLILFYIALGSLALRRAPSAAPRAPAFVAALVCPGMVATIAITHGSLDVFRMFGSLG